MCKLDHQKYKFVCISLVTETCSILLVVDFVYTVVFDDEAAQENVKLAILEQKDCNFSLPSLNHFGAR